MARETDAIISAIATGLQTRHPGMRDFSENSALSVLTEVISLQLRHEEQLIDSKSEALSILTATGDDLDALVTDRGLTRQPGTKSVGQITFSRRNPAASPITVPVGVKLAMSPEDGSAPIYFVTTAAGLFGVGDTQCVVDAEAYTEGESGNVGAYTITTILSLPSGVDGVTNPLAFTGGSDEEDDSALRNRYIYAVWTDGRATPKLIEEHLEALVSVLEAQIFTCDYGDVEIVCDVAALPDDPPAEVGVCIEDNLAAGVTARGILAATVAPSGASITGLDDTRGGKIVLRASEEIINPDQVIVQYLTSLGDTHSSTINIPGGTHRGDVVVATLQEADDLVVEVTGITYIGTYTYDVLVGLGTYPYLWVMPEMVPIVVLIYVTQTATPETGLKAKIEASVRAFLDDYKIGDDFELSDLVEWIKFDYVQYAEDGTFYRFQGIDNYTVQCTGKGVVKTALGDTITIENDERVEPGAITVTMS